MKETARGTAAVALLPSKETLSGAYFDLAPASIKLWRRPKPKGRCPLPSLGSIRFGKRLIVFPDWRGMTGREAPKSMSQSDQCRS